VNCTSTTDSSSVPKTPFSVVSRGSTWHRWDLHVHSPASFESSFGSPAEEDTWNRYAGALVRAAREHEVVAISLQDYFTTRGYEELVSRELYDPEEKVIYGGDERQRLLIIPGMEVRFEAYTEEDTALNAHLYFDPSIYHENTTSKLLSSIKCLQYGGA
jgi:hypothetical protein